MRRILFAAALLGLAGGAALAESTATEHKEKWDRLRDRAAAESAGKRARDVDSKATADAAEEALPPTEPPSPKTPPAE